MSRAVVPIGGARRLVLDDLRSLSQGDARLEFRTADDAAEGGGGDESAAAATSALASLSLEDEAELLAPEATIASLALLASSLSQGRIVRGDCASKLVDKLAELVNRILNEGTALRLPADSAAFAKAANALVGDDLGILEDGPYLGRIVSLARMALMLSQGECLRDGHAEGCFSSCCRAVSRMWPLDVPTLNPACNFVGAARSLSSRSVCDPISALSIERLGKYLSLEPFAAREFDELRPHRGCVESASVVRSCLQGSTLVQATEKTAAACDAPSAAAVKYARTVPQYHGPAREAIAAACKAVELEANCAGNGGVAGAADDTVTLLAGRSALEALAALANGSVVRVGGEEGSVPSSGEVSALEGLAGAMERSVGGLKRVLGNEAKMGCSFVAGELARREEETRAREAEKAQRAAERGNANPNVNGGGEKDEFAGMDEKKKAKILRKRAEKEAKAAAKRKAKEAKASGGTAALSSIFGAGTAAVYPLLTASSPIDLTDPALLAGLEGAMDALLSGGTRRAPKVPKGTRDYLPDQMAIRDEAFNIIRRVFKRHGAVEIDTPVFELKETLTGKYGEDSKLIYDLADQGGELLALRYDLTVPFARFLASNAVGNIKRFHIGKVYRRDQPALSRGRYREFYQCDFDIAGSYGRMVPDAECLAVACEILDALPIGDFGIKLNHRRLLDAILDICGVPADKFRTICSAVDKLDKEPWDAVRREMVEEKGLAGDVADRIGKFVVLKGAPWEMYKSLTDEKMFGDHKGAAEAMEDLRICFEYLEAMGKLQFISFDLSLARGLDYYTGIIYEAVCMNGNTQVGSIGGGGRYDNLVGMFQEAGKQTPCVGVSVGIERVFTLMEERLRQEQGGSIKRPNVSVLVASAGEGLLRERMRLARVLWDANISAEFSRQENPKLKFEIADALDRNIPFMIIAGEEEVRGGTCRVKDLGARTEETVDVNDLVRTLRGKGVVPVGCEFAAEMLDIERK
ncbi:hypothetical protein ACHAWF_010882 [Thalassiosira exigua]